jgi:hypothetical protein
VTRARTMPAKELMATLIAEMRVGAGFSPHSAG